GGQQQRVALARALLSAPRLLLLDEPFSALDADLRQRLRGEFAQRITEAGMACILVTHDEAEARAMGQRGYRLVAGQLQTLW
ncbi:MAG: ATP-binding cassette domain-containing protein, partial [Burkholderiaceae bacterium]|nr:ATP-binding cassette domain-containing protein [Burkholderiaceae bacterium]